MRTVLLFLCGFVFLSGHLSAQERVVTGTVLDANGAVVPSASITVKGSKRGTASGADGNFRITVPASAKALIISGINLASTEVDITGKTNLGNITLQTRNKSLDEVVVVAYGTAKKSDLTGSVVTVNGGQLADKPFSSVDKTLQGSVAGLQVTSTSGAPGSATDIRLRGIGSITASASPLWVIDGVIANTNDVSVNTTTANPLSSLNPDDIESISVLKDAASAAIYGSRAANGVIIVTTKKGKAGLTHFNLVTEIGQNSQAYKPSNKPMNSIQYQNYLRQGSINAGYATDNATADAFIIDPANGLGLMPNYASVYTDWHDVVTQKGNQSQVNLNLSGGNEKTQFYASAGFFNQIGTSIATDFRRFNGAFSLTHKASDRFTFSTTVSGSNAIQNTPSSGGAFSNPVGGAYFLQPWYTPYTPDGKLRYNQYDSLFEFQSSVKTSFNPVVQAAFDKNTYNQTIFRGNVTGEAKIIDNLKFTSRFAAEYSDISEDQYRNPFYGDADTHGGDAFSAYHRIFDYTWSNFFDFRQGLNKDNDFMLSLKAGFEAQEYKKFDLQSGAQGFPQTLSLRYLASAATPNAAFSLPTSSSTTSIFTLGDINYKERYILSASFRRDGSSVFGANRRYGNFYSVGGAWNISKEDFFNSQELISNLKLRSSYGETGNALGFGLYTPIATYGFGYNYAGQPGSAPASPGNPNLTWEKNKMFNIALDFGLLKNRISGTFEYYHRTTDDLLLSVPLSYTAGVINPVDPTLSTTSQNTQNENVGSLVNKGIELTLAGTPVVTKDFTWTVSFNIAHNVNRVTSLYLNNPIASPNGNFVYTVGHDLLNFFTRQWAGVDPANGDALWYTDSTRKTTTNNVNKVKRVMLPNRSASPKFFGALTNTFSFKGITLDVQFNYNFGNYLYDSWGNYLLADGAQYAFTNQLTKQLQAWQKPGDKTDVPQIRLGGNNNSDRNSTRYLYKGDFIRMRNIQIAYVIPTALLQKIHIGSASIYFRGTNLFTFGTDKDLPYDPESGVYNSTNLEVFIPKTITGGIRIGF
ncbi:SusC/RagA family TonB-linked outer membrane protein [Flavitalea flava]